MVFDFIRRRVYRRQLDKIDFSDPIKGMEEALNKKEKALRFLLKDSFKKNIREKLQQLPKETRETAQKLNKKGIDQLFDTHFETIKSSIEEIKDPKQIIFF